MDQPIAAPAQGGAAEPAEERWADFDRMSGVRALTLAELRRKMEHAHWALAERGCPEEAARMLTSCIADLEHAQD